MRCWIFILILILLVPFCSAAHYIVGIVNNARDGTSANDRTVVLWNPANGINDNLTDIIGVNGNSGADNNYKIDCELLDNGCYIGDEIRVKVFGDDGYITNPNNLSVTGAGSDVMDNLTLNSPPNVSLNSPVNYANLSLNNIDFNCSFSDLDSNTANITLYGNWSGGWHANETLEISGNGSVIFTKILEEGKYEWNCYVSDDLGAIKFAENNFTLTVDKTAPLISSVLINESYLCGSNYVRVNCTASDGLSGVENVIIEAAKPSGKQNYSASLLTGDTYYADILVNEIGGWSFNCIVNDSAGNLNNLSSQILNLYSNSPDIVLYSWEIVFNNPDPVENEGVVINATIYNTGCNDANDFLVGFYNGDPDFFGEQISNNKTISVPGLSNTTINITWNAEIGYSNIFIVADVNYSITEANESNNKANNSINVGAWQEFYGNISEDKILASYSLFNMSAWLNESNLGGNIFIADSESDIDWFSLQAIGKDIADNDTSNDFSDIDSLLNMEEFKDSVSISFENRSYTDFLVHQRIIENVSVINSTFDSDFITGILWDMNDDSDGEFSQEDREDLIFISSINKGKRGAYGFYDYELKIPVKLREYNANDTNEIYLYYDLS